MTTRLGIEAPDTENWPDPKKDENLQQLSAELNAMCKSIVQKQGDIHPAWLRPLSELTYSLVRLSRMPVLDEFAYLMLPGVHAFLKRLNEGTSPDHNAYQLGGADHVCMSFRCHEDLQRTPADLHFDLCRAWNYPEVVDSAKK